MNYLLVGGTKEERQKRAVKISGDEFKISNFDTLLITGETSIGIEQIRNLEHQLSLKPYNSAYKLALIHPGELLTIEAQNALLKALEETNETSILVLTAPQIDVLLPTVVSRCQIIHLPSKPAIELEEKSLAACYSLLIDLLKSGVGERLKFASKLGKDREEIKAWLEKQIAVCREALLREAVFLTRGQLVKIIRDLQKTKTLIEQNVNPRLALETFLIDLPNLSS